MTKIYANTHTPIQIYMVVLGLFIFEQERSCLIESSHAEQEKDLNQTKIAF